MSRLPFLSLIIVMSWCSCIRSTPGSDALYHTGAIDVYPDSIVIGSVEYRAVNSHEITNAWMDTAVTDDDSPYPRLHSSSRMADALFTKSLAGYTSAPLSSTDIYLSGAIMDPDRSMTMLRSMVSDDGSIHHIGYPLRASREAWAAAAWQVYCATGSESWLKEAYSVINRSYRREISVTSAGRGLIHGTPSYMSPSTAFFPSWMLPADEFMTICLGTNLWHYATLSTATAMAARLRLKAERDWEDSADATRNSINDNFWVPATSFYGQYFYGDMYPILSPSADNYANALAVILGVATPEMASRLMASRPSRPEGMPTVFPPANDGGNVVMPVTQTLQGIAAAMVGDEEALLASIGALWCMSLDETPSIQWPSLLLRGLFGLQLTPEGISFSPVIPGKLQGRKSLTSLRYRDAVLDINIHGSGDKIASFAIDSVHSDHAFIDSSITGHHRIDITMTGNNITGHARPPYFTSQETAPSTPRIYWEDNRRAKIINFDMGATYEIYLNGILSENISSPEYTLTDTGTTVVSVVPVVDKMSGFSPRAHVSAPDRYSIHIPATAITPRRPPRHLIPYPELASRYIELAARHNTRLTFYVQAPADGEYFIKIAYSNGTTDTALRSLEVNGSYSGTLVCPPGPHNDWITTQPSSTLTARLTAGPNKLSLTYIGTTILLHDIYLLKK